MADDRAALAELAAQWARVLDAGADAASHLAAAEAVARGAATAPFALARVLSAMSREAQKIAEETR